MKHKVIYKIYVEGVLHDETTSKIKALKLKSQYENEGWNVNVVRFENTVLGLLGIEIE